MKQIVSQDEIIEDRKLIYSNSARIQFSRNHPPVDVNTPFGSDQAPQVSSTFDLVTESLKCSALYATEYLLYTFYFNNEYNLSHELVSKCSKTGL